jgi:hypothetical protein
LSELGSIFPSGYLFSCVAIAIVCECVSVCLSLVCPAALESKI